MNRPTGLPSIRRRLLGALLAIGFLWGVTTVVVLGLVVRHEVDELLDHGLQEASELILGLMKVNGLPSTPGGTLPAPQHDEQLVWQLLDPKGALVMRSHRAPTLPMAGARSTGFSNFKGWRVHALPFQADGTTLLVAQNGNERSQARLETVLFAVAVAVALGLLAVAVVQGRMRRELKAINTLADAVRLHDPLARNAHLPPPKREELAPIHEAIDGLSQRLAKRVSNEQSFAAHAAHALRTPLATVITHLAVAQKRATNPADRHALQRSRDAANRLRRVVAALVTMFRTGNEPKLERIDLDDLLSQLGFESLELPVEGDAPIHADPDLLAAALMNLLENARRHGATRVTLRLSTETGGGTCIDLQDNGRGVPPDERNALQAAMDEEDYAGRTGLGLMLADLVARAHGGRCQLQASDAGFRVALRLKSA